MSIYKINFTDTSKAPLIIQSEALTSSAVDITLIGQSTMEYGEVFDENLLHILENFACPEDAATPGTPDLTKALSPLLTHPIEGQFWFNKSNLELYVYTGKTWSSMAGRPSMSANSGLLVHGQQIPLPVGFTAYSQCAIFVSPQYLDEKCSYFECYVDDGGYVHCRYYGYFAPQADVEWATGIVNYLIVGIKGEAFGSVPPAPQPPAASPTPTPTLVTPTPTVTTTPTLTPTPTVTPSVHAYVYFMYAQIVAVAEGFSYVGYNQYFTYNGVNTLGSLSPNTFQGYTINGIESVQGPNLVLELMSAPGAPPAPANIFSLLSFVDALGVARSFASYAAVVSYAVVNGNNVTVWSWNISSLGYDYNSPIFIPNSNYIIQIEE